MIRISAQARLLPVLVALMLGCSKSQGQDHAASPGKAIASPDRLPTAADRLAATAPNYSTPKGTLQECLGRLIFDVAKPVEWPTFYDSQEGDARSSAFTKTIRPNGGEIMFGSTKVQVYGPVNSTISTWLSDETPSAKMARERALISEANAEIAVLKRDQHPTVRTKNKIENLHDDIASREKQLADMSSNISPFDPGVPNSQGYSTAARFGSDQSTLYSVVHSKLVRGQYVFVFESTQEIKPAANAEQHRQQFTALLKRFKPRAMHEIPDGLGVCIPHGFIADDGKTATDINQSLRWLDAPGVLYSIHAGTASERKDKTPAVTAIATAAIGRLGSQEENEIKPFVTERIGPRSVYIGGLKASQGGVALKVTEKGKQPYETYNVFTGYPGFWGSEVLPYILIEMSTRTRMQATELKQNPPPFKQSMERLDLLLKNVRLRPTGSLMPER